MIIKTEATQMTQHEPGNLPPCALVTPNFNGVATERGKRSLATASTTPITKREGQANLKAQDEPGNESPHVSITHNSDKVTPTATLIKSKEVTIPKGSLTVVALRTAIRLLRYPIAFFLVFYSILIIGRGDSQYDLLEILHSVDYSATPLCRILPTKFLCQENTTHESSKGSSRVHSTSPWAAKTKLEEGIFDTLMNETVGGVALSLEMKDVQMAISDLAVLVHGSDLKQKNMIAKMLNELRNDAREVGGSLQRFAKKAEGSLDSIMAANDWALQSIQRAKESESHHWFPEALMPWRPTTTTDEVIAETFHEAMYVLEQHLRRLILEAEVSELALKSLDERVVNLRGILEHEVPTKAIETVEYETLEVLWFVAQHRSTRVIRHERDEELLKNLRVYAREASVHLATALKFLRDTSAEMEDIRERVAKPSLMGRSLPVEVHLQTITAGLDRMELRRIGARNAEREEIRRVMERRFNGSEDPH